MSSYKIANPYIEGDFKNLFLASNRQQAAKKAWESLSEHFANNMPQFGFSMEKLNDGSLSHFVVKESAVKGGNVKYSITEIHPKSDTLKESLKAVQKKAGGKHEEKKHEKHHVDDDSSSTSSDSDFDLDDSSELSKQLKYKKMVNKSQQLFTYWWYDPTVYDLGSVYVPTFSSLVYTPVFEVKTNYGIYSPGFWMY